MSLARLAAEEAFRPQPSTRATDPGDNPTERAPVEETVGSGLIASTIEPRKPRVFRLAAPAATNALPQTSALSEGATVAAVPVRKSSPDKRPGPVSVVYSRPAEPGVENPSSPDAVPATTLPARPSPASSALADGVLAAGFQFAPLPVTYRDVMAGLAKLSAVIAEIKAARSFTV